MHPFRLADPDLAALGAGRPSPGTLALLRRAQVSRHLLLLRELRLGLGKNPMWYDRLHALPVAEARTRIADPMTGLWAAQALSATRSGAPHPAGDLPEPSGHVLSVTHAGRTLTVRLDDHGPLRHLLGLAPADPLTPAEVAHWRNSLAGAWRILIARHPAAADLVDGVLRVIVPARPDPRAEGVSATSAAAFGAVAMSAPANDTSLAVALLHETHHSVLNAVHGLFELVQPESALGYSPWRDDPRPAFGILHGVYAFLAVTRFWRAELSSGTGAGEAEFEFARWRAAVHTAAGDLLYGGQLTAAGIRLTGALRDEAGPWRGEPVGAEVERLADLARADHHARWRLRNLIVAPEDVDALAEAWRAGRAAPPVGSTVTGAERTVEPSPRLRMIRELLRGDLAGPQDGDVACVRGDAGAALTAYRISLGINRDQEPAWSGLALVSPHPALRRRPELVRAAALALPEADIADVATWLSRAGEG
ncbi:aKG-HExxH-type peptide beta-hydroxylase [Actinoplanes sp. NPDC020271]|uniref:aKG-HExxH-type peptide beta-hydroxylase n=1 Tax=Actinoplanes sp. NPDC020271 TaxID=3363896 RepID=UPI0037A1DEC2